MIDSHNNPVSEAASPLPLKILLLGSSGMLGSDLLTALLNRNHHVRSPLHSDFDLNDPYNIDRLRKQDFGTFDWIVNCAAYTAVDKAESESMAAMRLNAVLPGMLALAAQGCNARVLHLSTDFVFDGTADTPYTELSEPNPLSVYGKSKLLGEHNLLKEALDSVICRTGWLYGPNGKSFPRTMVEAFRAGKELRVVNDQAGCPTYTADLARLLCDLLESNPTAGIYHTVGPDTMTWHSFARLAVQTDLQRQGQDPALADQIIPVPTSEYPTPAKRPRYSVLSTQKIESLGFGPLRPTAEALVEFLSRLESSASKS